LPCRAEARPGLRLAARGAPSCWCFQSCEVFVPVFACCKKEASWVDHAEYLLSFSSLVQVWPRRRSRFRYCWLGPSYLVGISQGVWPGREAVHDFCVFNRNSFRCPLPPFWHEERAVLIGGWRRVV